MSDTGLPFYRTPAEVRAIPQTQWEEWARNGGASPDLFSPDDGCLQTADAILRATRRRLDAMELPPGARRLDVRATRAAFAAGTLGTVGDDPAGEDAERDAVARNADRHNPDDVQHEAKHGRSEAERQAWLRRVQHVDPRERRA